MSGVIGWFARNGVAANLLMVFIVVWGLLAMIGMPIEVFPSLETQSITVTVPYLGAAPEEVEQGVSLRVEEAVQEVYRGNMLATVLTFCDSVGKQLVRTGVDVAMGQDDKSKYTIDTGTILLETKLLQAVGKSLKAGVK